jgi:hypothetical protein
VIRIIIPGLAGVEQWVKVKVLRGRMEKNPRIVSNLTMEVFGRLM